MTSKRRCDRLEINNGAGVSLGTSNDLTVDTELILTNGILTPATNKLLPDVDATVEQIRLAVLMLT